MASSQGWQEWVALAIVFAAAFFLFEAPFRGIVLKRFSEALLRRGRVKWAMRVRRWADPRWAKGVVNSAKHAGRGEHHCG